MNYLLSKLKSYGDFSKEVEDQLRNKIVVCQKKRGDFFIRKGQIATSIFILEKGAVRAFAEIENKETTLWLGFEDLILGSILPAYFDQPAFENIQFLEDSVVHSISIADLNNLYRMFPEMNIVGRKLAENYCNFLERRIQSLQADSATQRYQKLLMSEPDVIKRVPIKFIASYLGISGETLSRIRSRLN
ncbi:Cyclic nucleotide-binding domain protein [compost metagenome]